MATAVPELKRRSTPSVHAMQATPCRFCGTPLEQSFVDLGVQPPSNSYLRASELNCSEHFHPLHAHVCTKCFLVQLEQFESPEEIFSDYAYFSSYSESWLKHAKNYCEMITDRFELSEQHQVIEVASNDGYLLQNFSAMGIPVLGVEPAANVARVAEQKGVPTRVSFFGRATAKQLVEDGYAADLLIGNNVLAHVPDLNDFVAALRMTLKPEGVITMEFPHLLRLMEDCQFDTIYHEHFSYFSLSAAERVFHAHGMRLFDVEELPTHGGSLRIYACHLEGPHPLDTHIAELKKREEDFGLNEIGAYEGFSERVRTIKRRLLSFLISAKDEGKRVVAYGAAAKGNTLLNYCGIGPDMIDYVVDANPHKQGLYLPGTRIPIATPDKIANTRPDYVLILPWNLQQEIVSANSHVKGWGGKFVVPIPDVEIVK